MATGLIVVCVLRLAAGLVLIVTAAASRAVAERHVNYSREARLVAPDPRGDNSVTVVVSSDLVPNTSVAVIAYECNPVSHFPRE